MDVKKHTQKKSRLVKTGSSKAVERTPEKKYIKKKGELKRRKNNTMELSLWTVFLFYLAIDRHTVLLSIREEERKKEKDTKTVVCLRPFLFGIVALRHLMLA